MTALLLLACTDPGSTFGVGGSWSPHPADTSPPKIEDTGDTSETGDTDTDTSETADTSDSGENSGIPGSEDCGTGLNKVACNLTGQAQSGQDWELWNHYPATFAVVIGHAYDQQFITISAYLQGAADARGAIPVAVVLDNLNQVPAEQQDAGEWAAAHGLDTVLWDNSGDIRSTWAFTSNTVTYVIDEEMTIRWIGYGYVDEDQLDNKLKNL